MTCPVCCEAYNKSTRNCITCPSGCDFSACKECIRTYLTSNTKDPNCMNCSAMWSFRFCSEKLNKSFMSTNYMSHRADVLIEREMSMVPATMETACRRKQINDLKEEQFKIIEARNKLLRDVNALGTTFSRINEEIYALERKTKGNARKFVMPCPAPECRGFLSTQYKCEICSLWTCKTCCSIIGDGKDDPHECSEDAVASTELIRQSTHPCPTCGIRITKISGCDQMWCVECRTAFSWKTGVIETGVVHNPHFYEYRELTGNQPNNGNDRPLTMCDNLDPVPFQTFNNIILLPLSRFYDKKQIECPGEILLFQRIYGLYAHMTHYELTGGRRDIQMLENNEESRVEYILGNITKEHLRAVVSNKDKKRRRLVETTNVMEVYCEVSKDVLNSILNFPTPDMNDLDDLVKHIMDCFQQLDNVREYCNGQWREISASNGITTHFITYDFTPTRRKYGIREMKAKQASVNE